MLEVINLNKYYGSRHALEGVTFSVRSGGKMGLLGLPSSGKTSVLRMLAGYGRPTLGQAKLNGLDPEIPSVRKSLGYLPEDNPLPFSMRVWEYLTFRGALKGLGRKDTKAAAERMLETWDLTRVRDALIGRLRPVLRLRVGLADCFLAKPSVVLLDEPTGGLEPSQAAAILPTIAELSQETTMLLASSQLRDVDALCRRAVILDSGKVVAMGRLSTLYAKYIEERTITIELLTSEPVREAFRAMPGVRAVSAVSDPHNPSHVTVSLAMPSGVDLRKEFSLIAAKRGWVVTEMRLEPVRLDDLFRRLNRGG